MAPLLPGQPFTSLPSACQKPPSAFHRILSSAHQTLYCPACPHCYCSLWLKGFKGLLKNIVSTSCIITYCLAPPTNCHSSLGHKISRPRLSHPTSRCKHPSRYHGIYHQLACRQLPRFIHLYVLQVRLPYICICLSISWGSYFTRSLHIFSERSTISLRRKKSASSS